MCFFCLVLGGFFCCCCLVFGFKENEIVLQVISFLTLVLSAGGDTGFMLIVNSMKNSLLASWVLCDVT